MFRIKKPRTFLAALAGATALLFAVAPSAQEEEAGGGPDLLSEAHRWLARDAGVWEAKCTWHGPEGAQPFEGKETVTVDCGGLWVFGTFEADFMGAPFKGRSVTGYDPESKKVLGAWVDSMTTTIARLEGRIEGDRLVLTTEGKDPVTGEPYPQKHVHTRQGNGERTFEMIALREGGEHLLMKIVYTRVK